MVAKKKIALPDGDVPVTAEIRGEATAAGAFLTVRRN
jgi:hypothetical protein